MSDEFEELRLEINRAENKREDLRHELFVFEKEINEQIDIMYNEDARLNDLAYDNLTELKDVQIRFADYEDTMRTMRLKTEECLDETSTDIKQTMRQLEDKERELKDRLNYISKDE